MRVMRWGLILVVAVAAMAVASAEVVDSEGLYTSLALDSNDYPHISYYDYTNDDLKYAYKDSTGWHIEKVSDGGLHTSIALDLYGNPHISYHCWPKGLLYAYKNASGWHIEVVDGDVEVDPITSRTSIAVRLLGPPPSQDFDVHISYYDPENGDLKYAHKGNVTGYEWGFSPIDSEGDVGAYSSLALDSYGNPHISYYDATNGSLKYAYYRDYRWHFEVVDGEGDENVGLYTSIALDSNNNPHIVYYDETNDDLKYAYYDGTDWHIEVVESIGDVGVALYTSIALDSNDQPHISYYEWGNLKYAYRTYGWYIEVIEEAGLYTSIALDSNDNPHISYNDESDLKYTTKQPTIVNLQGGITDSNGLITTASMRVTIENADGGYAVHQETFNDFVTDGRFDVLLGATQRLELWSGVAYNLIIEVDVGSTTFNQADVTFGDDTPAGDIIVFYP